MATAQKFIPKKPSIHPVEKAQARPHVPKDLGTSLQTTMQRRFAELETYITTNDFNKIKEYISKYGMDFTLKDENDNTIVHFIVNNSQLTEDQKVLFLNYFIRYNTPFTSFNKENITPLHMACRLQEPKVVKCLLEHGADTNVTDNYKMTPLHYVVRGKRIETKMEDNGNVLIDFEDDDIQKSKDIFEITEVLLVGMRNDPIRFYLNGIQATLGSTEFWQNIIIDGKRLKDMIDDIKNSAISNDEKKRKREDLAESLKAMITARMGQSGGFESNPDMFELFEAVNYLQKVEDSLENSNPVLIKTVQNSLQKNNIITDSEAIRDRLAENTNDEIGIIIKDTLNIFGGNQTTYSVEDMKLVHLRNLADKSRVSESLGKINDRLSVMESDWEIIFKNPISKTLSDWEEDKNWFNSQNALSSDNFGKMNTILNNYSHLQKILSFAQKNLSKKDTLLQNLQSKPITDVIVTNSSEESLDALDSRLVSLLQKGDKVVNYIEPLLEIKRKYEGYVANTQTKEKINKIKHLVLRLVEIERDKLEKLEIGNLDEKSLTHLINKYQTNDPELIVVYGPISEKFRKRLSRLKYNGYVLAIKKLHSEFKKTNFDRKKYSALLKKIESDTFDKKEELIGLMRRNLKSTQTGGIRTQPADPTAKPALVPAKPDPIAKPPVTKLSARAKVAKELPNLPIRNLEEFLGVILSLHTVSKGVEDKVELEGAENLETVVNLVQDKLWILNKGLIFMVFHMGRFSNKDIINDKNHHKAMGKLYQFLKSTHKDVRDLITQNNTTAIDILVSLYTQTFRNKNLGGNPDVFLIPEPKDLPETYLDLEAIFVGDTNQEIANNILENYGFPSSNNPVIKVTNTANINRGYFVRPIKINDVEDKIQWREQRSKTITAASARNAISHSNWAEDIWNQVQAPVPAPANANVQPIINAVNTAAMTGDAAATRATRRGADHTRIQESKNQAARNSIRGSGLVIPTGPIEESWESIKQAIDSKDRAINAVTAALASADEAVVTNQLRQAESEEKDAKNAKRLVENSVAKTVIVKLPPNYDDTVTAIADLMKDLVGRTEIAVQVIKAKLEAIRAENNDETDAAKAADRKATSAATKASDLAVNSISLNRTNVDARKPVPAKLVVGMDLNWETVDISVPGWGGNQEIMFPTNKEDQFPIPIQLYDTFVSKLVVVLSKEITSDMENREIAEDTCRKIFENKYLSMKFRKMDEIIESIINAIGPFAGGGKILVDDLVQELEGIMAKELQKPTFQGNPMFVTRDRMDLEAADKCVMGVNFFQEENERYCYKVDPRIVRMLLDNRARPGMLDSYNMYPINYSIELQDEASIRILAARSNLRCDINCQSPQEPLCYLFYKIKEHIGFIYGESESPIVGLAENLRRMVPQLNNERLLNINLNIYALIYMLNESIIWTMENADSPEYKLAQQDLEELIRDSSKKKKKLVYTDRFPVQDDACLSEEDTSGGLVGGADTDNSGNGLPWTDIFKRGDDLYAFYRLVAERKSKKDKLTEARKDSQNTKMRTLNRLKSFLNITDQEIEDGTYFGKLDSTWDKYFRSIERKLAGLDTEIGNLGDIDIDTVTNPIIDAKVQKIKTLEGFKYTDFDDLEDYYNSVTRLLKYDISGIQIDNVGAIKEFWKERIANIKIDDIPISHLASIHLMKNKLSVRQLHTLGKSYKNILKVWIGKINRDTKKIILSYIHKYFHQYGLYYLIYKAYLDLLTKIRGSEWIRNNLETLLGVFIDNELKNQILGMSDEMVEETLDGKSVNVDSYVQRVIGGLGMIDSGTINGGPSVFNENIIPKMESFVTKYLTDVARLIESNIRMIDTYRDIISYEAHLVRIGNVLMDEMEKQKIEEY